MEKYTGQHFVTLQPPNTKPSLITVTDLAVEPQVW